MKNAFYILILFVILLPLFSWGQNFGGKIIIVAQNERQATREFLDNKNSNSLYDTLIKNKETAIAFAEPILFKTYGKKNIKRQKPYKCYLIDGNWHMSGSLPIGWKGGVFLIIIDSSDGRIIKLTHGK